MTVEDAYKEWWDNETETSEDSWLEVNAEIAFKAGWEAAMASVKKDSDKLMEALRLITEESER